MAHKNLLNKWKVSDKDLKIGIEVAIKSLVKLSNHMVTIALTELLTNGDIDEKKR